MDDDKSSQFVVSLIKSIQALCQGYIDFNSTVEVIGHIHLNVDQGTKFDYVLTEEINKSEADSTLFCSHSYHSKPPSQAQPQVNTLVKSSTALLKSGSRRKSALIPRDIDNTSFSYTISNSNTSSSSTAAVPISSDRNSPRIISVSTLAQPGSLQHKAGVDDFLAPPAKRSCNDESALSKTATKDSGLNLTDVKVKQEILDEEEGCYNSSTPDAGHRASDLTTHGASQLAGHRASNLAKPGESDLARHGASEPAGHRASDLAGYRASDLASGSGASGLAAAVQQLHQPFPLLLHVKPRQSDVVPVPSTSGIVASKANALIPGSKVNICFKSQTVLKEGSQNQPNKDCVIRYFLKDGMLFPVLSKDQNRDTKMYIVKQNDLQQVIQQPQQVNSQQPVMQKAESNIQDIKKETEEILKKERPNTTVPSSLASSGSMKKKKVSKSKAKLNVARKSTTASKSVRISLQEHSGFHSRYKSTRKAKASLNRRVQRRYSASGYMDYTEEDMNAAIDLVHKGMPVIEAALELGIPRASLFNRSRDGCKTHTGRCSEVFPKSAFDFQKKRKHMQYTQEQFEKAIEAIHKGMPVIDASFIFKIPRATLFIRSSKGCPTHSGRCATVFSHGKIHRTKVYKHKYRELMEKSISQEDAADMSSKIKRKRNKNFKHKQLPSTAAVLTNDPVLAVQPVVDPSSGKIVNIPLKVDLVSPCVDVNMGESSQATEEIGSEHQFETLTTSDSSLVFKRLKERMKSNSPSQRKH